MESRHPRKGRSTEDNVECLGLWLYGAEKTAHFLHGRRKQGCGRSYRSYVDCAWRRLRMPCSASSMHGRVLSGGCNQITSNRGMSVRVFMCVKRPIDSSPLHIPCVLRSAAALLCDTPKTSRSLLLALWSFAVNEPSGYIL